MATQVSMDTLFEALGELKGQMRASRPAYQAMKALLIEHFRCSSLAQAEGTPFAFGPFGELKFPYRKMGAIDSVDLFGIDELLIFSYYWANRQRYKSTLDLGANLGLHSIIMARCGFNVTAFEPDPVHQQLLLNNLERNKVQNVKLERAAISDRDGTAEFVRVVGNTTGSHLAGAKSNPYGDLDRFTVEVRAIEQFASKADFAKMDVEGHEIAVLGGISSESWNKLDVLMEIGTADNATAVMDYAKSRGLNLFSQLIGWEKAKTASDLPSSHREGSVILSRRDALLW